MLHVLLAVLIKTTHGQVCSLIWRNGVFCSFFKVKSFHLKRCLSHSYRYCKNKPYPKSRFCRGVPGKLLPCFTHTCVHSNSDLKQKIQICCHMVVNLQLIKPTSSALVRFWCAKVADSDSLVVYVLSCVVLGALRDHWDNMTFSWLTVSLFLCGSFGTSAHVLLIF